MAGKEERRPIAAGDAGALKIFISYSRRDMAIADALVTALEAAAFTVTIDRRDLPYGEEWQTELADFIRASDTVVWLVSPDSVTSKWCNWELGEVGRLAKRLIPVRIRDIDPATLPEALGRIHLLPSEGVYEPKRHFTILASVLETDRAWVKEGTSLADRARQWLGASESATAGGAEVSEKNPRVRDDSALLSGRQLARAEAWRLRQPSKAPRPSQDVLDLILTSRQAATRRQNRTITAAIAVSMLSIGLAGMAWWQRGVAVTQRDRAERALSEVVSTTDGMVYNLAAKLQDRAGTPQQFITSILKEARRPLDSLIEEAARNPDIALSRALALTELSSTLLAQEDADSARDAAEKAVAQLASEKGARTRDPDWRLARVGASERLARAEMALGQTDAAETAFRDSLRFAQALERAAPSDLDWRQSLASARQNMGDVMLVRSEASPDGAPLTEARQHYLASLALRQAIANTADATTDSRREVAVAVGKLGDVLLAEGQPAEALTKYQASLGLIEPLAAAAPDNTKLQRDLAIANQDIANALAEDGQAAQAIAWLRKDLAISLRLTQSDDQLLWRRDLVASYSRLAEALTKTGAFDEALTTHRSGLTVAAETIARDPHRPFWRRDQAATLESIGGLEAKRDDHVAALAAFVGALGIREELASATPANSPWRDEIGDTYRRVSETQLELGRLSDALDTATRYVAAMRATAATVPNDDAKLRLARALGTASWTALLARNPDRAVAAAREAVEIAPQLQWLRINLAHSLMFAGARDEAKAMYAAGLAGAAEQAAEWKSTVRSDFETLRAEGLAKDSMIEIDAMLN